MAPALRNLRSGVIPVVLLLALVFGAGCANMETSTRRFGKDLAVVFSYPVHAPVAAARDAAKEAEERLWIGIPMYPVSFLAHLLKHTYATIPYLLDAPLYPLYLPFGAEPIDFYTLDGFPYTFNSPNLSNGVRRTVQSASIALATPVTAIVAGAHDTWLYIVSEPWKRYLMTPAVFLIHVTRHVFYGVVHAVDAIFAPLLMPFGLEPLKFYDWPSFPFQMATRYNKATNRLYKDVEISLAMPFGILGHTGYDFGGVWGRHPVATTIFSPFVFTWYFLKHTTYHLFYVFDALLYPVYFFNPGGMWDTYELYITGSWEVHPILEGAIGQRLVASSIIVGSALMVAATQANYQQAEQAYNENPNYDNQRRLDEARQQRDTTIDDSGANAVVAGTYLAFAAMMENSLATVRGFRRPKTAMEFLRYLGQGRAEMEALEAAPSLTTNDVPDGVASLSMEHYRDVMNRVLYERELLLFDEARERILKRFGSIEMEGSRVDQLTANADVAPLVSVMNEMMAAYIALPGSLAAAQGGIDALTANCDAAIVVIDRALERGDSAYERRFGEWRREILRIRYRQYTLDAIYRRLRELLVEGYLELYEYQALNY